MASLKYMESVSKVTQTLQAIAAKSSVKKLTEAFQVAGFDLALVGGPVRDAFLGRAITDLDLTTNALPEQIEAVVKPISKTIWDVGREFGTIACLIEGERFEITTYRSDEYDPASRKPQVKFGKTLEGDLKRRDFSVNSLAIKFPGLELVDAGRGVEDLMGKVIDTPDSPQISFSDDPLRMLRAARFASQLGFKPAERVVEAMREMAERIQIISAERIREELEKLLLSEDPITGIELLVNTGLAEYVLPELVLLKETVDTQHRHKDVYQHCLKVLEQAIDLEKSRGHKPNLVLRIAALLHDIGKPVTRRFEHGAVTFHNHDVVGAKMARKRLRDLKFDKSTTEAVSELVRLHLRFFGYTEALWTDSAVRRYVRDAGDLLEELHILTRADVTTGNQKKAERLEFAYDDLEERIAELAKTEELAAIRPDLDGFEIMEILGIPGGPKVGEAYNYLLELRLENGPMDKDAATVALKEWATQVGK